MISSGLVSITFRKLSPESIVALVTEAGLQSIEWGGDIHIPHGNIQKAKEVLNMTTDANLKVACYGSYYKVGEKPADKKDSFASILDTAIALQAPIIRVWAGTKPSKNADTEYRRNVIEDSIHIAELAASANIKISYEYHNYTLTDEPESVILLMREANHPNIYFHWQPNQNRNSESAAKELHAVLPRLSAIHVFHWQIHNGELIREPLSNGSKEWLRYLRIANTKNEKIAAMIEFVKNDSEKQFLQDASTLKSWIKKISMPQQVA